ncbi:copper homeostasis protein cutC [Crucibulum laeve]|uniref:Copper homeostasis protein cutC homolog n=1 Tax=Crucibulum laeve TaxID=68775 RepID=A0A5C3MBN9_9AGAR|nr:copper homeostasis protein cutC [Crucibulum laeve]
MIRPRTGDFIYSEDELEVMLEDIRVFKEYGVRGMVIGILTVDARVDVDRMKKLVNEIMPLEVCFHRAFDMTRDPKEALQDVASIGGITRILTSGHQPYAVSALSIFQALFVREAELVENDTRQQDLVIMPGSGINTNTITSVVEALLPFGLREVHLSGGAWVDSKMLFRREGMGMGVCGEGEWGVWHTLESKVREVRNKADTICEEINSRK